ncbi:MULTISPECIES: polysaccharide deacetylase family protein [Tenacibaculum]|uniref:polysaccharide deacetylase family protein n=1 Tax=Tenacibaculum TaxID=104267 RepID=UPI001F0AD069|nr:MULTISPECIES: polysaccharide deacetylase family protein [Tenacibaculum]MCH3881699.1 polysaccharide deacetylase family protein [Tenacibaculum aquimarinum]MDO6598719.1 polysaccharide deacetylase family protein [Tenacibaculum sp. 1_MG-2023]
MKLYFTKTPRIFTRIFSNYTWRFSSDKKEIYLTFDDGPTPEITDFVLSELQKYNAKATFFCIGKNVEKHPDIFKRLITEGHTVGNHTQNHFNGWKHKTVNYLNNIETASKLIESKLFRPPYGKIKASQGKELIKKGYKIIMWSVLSADFDTSISREQCLQNVLRNTNNGSIVVFHDSLKASEKLTYVLPKVLEEFSKKGFTFKAIT